MTDVSSASGDVVEFLHTAGDRYKEHRELLRLRELEQERQQCPFRPTVTEFAEHLHRESTARRSDAVEKRLHALHAKRLKAAAAKRAESDERAEAKDNAALRPPRVTARARSLSARDPVDVSRRWLEQRAANVSRLRDEALRRELNELRDAPHISARARDISRNGQTLDDRFAAQEAARRSRLFWLTEQSFSGSSAGDEQRPFTPCITERARRLQRDGSVVQRLHNATARSVSSDVPAASFVPRVSPASAELSRLYHAGSRSAAAGESVHERLFRNERPATRRTCAELSRAELSRAELSRAACTAVPRICETSRQIVARRRAAGDPPPHFTDPPRSFSPSSSFSFSFSPPPAAERAERAECTFRPRVNAQSARLWRRQVALLRGDGAARTAAEARGVLRRRAAERAEKRAADERRIAESAAAAECTFHPRVGRPPENRAGQRQITITTTSTKEEEAALSVAARAEAWRRRRDRRIAEARREAECARLAPCTFRPEVLPAFPLPNGEAEIAGYEAHVARQCVSRRRREEAELWWRPKKNRAAAQSQRGSEGAVRRSASSAEWEMWGIEEEEEDDEEEEEDGNALGTHFVVRQQPASRAAMIMSPPADARRRRSVDRVAHNTKPSPVDFILNHHRAIVESSRRGGA